jgi:regulator of replication initiation timing
MKIKSNSERWLHPIRGYCDLHHKKYRLTDFLLNKIQSATSNCIKDELLKFRGSELQKFYETSTKPAKMVQYYVQGNWVRLVKGIYYVNPTFVWFGSSDSRLLATTEWNMQYPSPEASNEVFSTLKAHSTEIDKLHQQIAQLKKDIDMLKDTNNAQSVTIAKQGQRVYTQEQMLKDLQEQNLVQFKELQEAKAKIARLEAQQGLPPF